jgi:hypothetical protein
MICLAISAVAIVRDRMSIGFAELFGFGFGADEYLWSYWLFRGYQLVQPHLDQLLAGISGSNQSLDS